MLSGGRPESPAEKTTMIIHAMSTGSSSSAAAAVAVAVAVAATAYSRGRRATLTRSRDYHDKGKPEQQRPVGD